MSYSVSQNESMILMNRQAHRTYQIYFIFGCQNKYLSFPPSLPSLNTHTLTHSFSFQVFKSGLFLTHSVTRTHLNDQGQRMMLDTFLRSPRFHCLEVGGINYSIPAHSLSLPKLTDTNTLRNKSTSSDFSLFFLL